jgi:PTS system nitrogen regulatory IIA component
MNWMTVKELAEYLKLSEVMIYKLAQKGEIPASKVGSAWRFSQREIDRWLLGQTGGMSWLKGQAKTVVENIVLDLQEHFGDNLSTVVIFGSYSRGDADEHSDLDICVVLKSIDGYWKVSSEVDRIAYANTFDKDISLVVAPILMSESEYLTGTSPLLMNIRKEGRAAA